MNLILLSFAPYPLIHILWSRYWFPDTVTQILWAWSPDPGILNLWCQSVYHNPMIVILGSWSWNPQPGIQIWWSQCHDHDTMNLILGSRFWDPDFGIQILGSRFWDPDFGIQILGSRFWDPDFGIITLHNKLDSLYQQLKREGFEKCKQLLKILFTQWHLVVKYLIYT